MTIESKKRDEVSRRIYLRMMDNQGVLNQKVSDLAGLVKPGLILDHGASSGHLIKEISQIFEDSDCKGVDVSHDMVALARKNFPEIDFIQADILEQVHDNNQVDTIICSSTLHELWSEHIDDDPIGTLGNYFNLVYNQLKSDGVFAIRGVGDFGDYMPTRIVDVELEENDGLSYEGGETPADLLSTRGRFKAFTDDFLRDIDYTLTKNGLFRLELKDIWEFCLTKDYTNVWPMEMTEEFCGFDSGQTTSLLREEGFEIAFERSYTNPWIKNNRLKNKVRLFEKGKRRELDYPPTNFVIMAVKNHGQ